MSHPAVQSTALNTSKPERIKENMAMVLVEIPKAFWNELKDKELISDNYPYL
jgi:D-threo-aldose 1-dehydrogenase